MTRRALQAVLGLMGGVATVAGSYSVLRGAAEFAKESDVPPGIDSEYRFYAAWYAVVGVLLLRAASRPEQESAIVRASCMGFLGAACGRALSLRTRGQPEALQRFLMILEFAIAPIILPWHARVMSARALRGPS